MYALPLRVVVMCMTTLFATAHAPCRYIMHVVISIIYKVCTTTDNNLKAALAHLHKPSSKTIVTDLGKWAWKPA